MGFEADYKERTAPMANSTCAAYSGSRKGKVRNVCWRLNKNTLKMCQHDERIFLKNIFF